MLKLITYAVWGLIFPIVILGVICSFIRVGFIVGMQVGSAFLSSLD